MTTTTTMYVPLIFFRPHDFSIPFHFVAERNHFNPRNIQFACRIEAESQHMRGINTLPVKRRLNKLLHVLGVPQERRWRYKPKESERESGREYLMSQDRENDFWSQISGIMHTHTLDSMCAVSLRVPFPESTYINGYNGWAMATSTVRPPLSTPSAEYMEFRNYPLSLRSNREQSSLSASLMLNLKINAKLAAPPRSLYWIPLEAHTRNYAPASHRCTFASRYNLVPTLYVYTRRKKPWFLLFFSAHVYLCIEPEI